VNTNKTNTSLPAILSLVCVAIFFTGGITYLSSAKQLLVAWCIVGFLFLANKFSADSNVLSRLIIMIFTLFLGVRYIAFRYTQTLSYTGFVEFFFVLLLFSTEIYSFLVQLVGIFVMAQPLNRPLQPVDTNDPDLPAVDIFIPTYNEAEQMVAITACAATQLDYPKNKVKIFILDDGGTVQKRTDLDPKKAKAAQDRHETLKMMAEFLEVHYLTREKNTHAKAGNINEALYGPKDGQVKPQGELILILDCDHVPTRDFLKNTVSHFAQDEKLFLVQTPHFFINPDPVERNLGTFNSSPGENEVFFSAIHLGLDFWNGSYFCGSAAILRRKYLDEAGGILGETITEDAETALFLHNKGYNSVYVNRPMVCGLSPETFDDFIIQRSRWAQGMIQIMLLKSPFKMKGLTVFQKICYFNLTIFWFFGLSRVIFFLAPLLYLFFGLQVYQASALQCLAYPLPYMAASILLTDFMFGSLRHPFFSELYEMAQSLYNIPAVLNVLISPRSPQFKVTPKSKNLASDFLSPLAYPFYVLLFLSLAMYPIGLARFWTDPLAWNAVLICLSWGSFNFLLLMLCLGIVWERKQLRSNHRLPVTEKIWLKVADPDNTGMLTGVTTDISEEGIGFIIPYTPYLKKGEKIKLYTKDNTGRGFTLPLKILRTSAREGKLIVGSQFFYDDELSFLYLTSYVYGDSQRWVNFQEKRRSRRISMSKGLLAIFWMGLQGASHHCKGLLYIFVFQLKKILWVGVWKRVVSILAGRAF
jgi:cellulose synthase (UDP-forming)